MVRSAERNGFIFAKSRVDTVDHRNFWRGDSRSRSGLLPVDSRWGYCLSIRERRGASPGVKACGLGQTMSGVIVAMRRTLLSCTSLARNRLIGLCATLVSIVPVSPNDFPLWGAISAPLDLYH